jgi:hypothetical protein
VAIEKKRRELDAVGEPKAYAAIDVSRVSLAGRRRGMIYLVGPWGWPATGNNFLPPGLRVDTSEAEFEWLDNIVPPPDCMALNQAAYNYMASAYPFYRILSGPGIARSDAGRPSIIYATDATDLTRLIYSTGLYGKSIAGAAERMLYQLDSQGWPIGQHHIPGGTRIDTSLPEWRYLADHIPPMNAQALDQNCYDVMAAKYPYNRILTGPGIMRHADPL